jgi:hypothetical protein
MKLNRMICPTCGHEAWTDAAYISCDSCQSVFYASQSAERRPPFSPFVTLGSNFYVNGVEYGGSTNA